MDKMNKAMEKMKILVGMEVEEEEEESRTTSVSSIIDDFNRDCTLSTKQRLYGFAICLVAGLACTLLSMLVFFNPIKFGITFTFGNLLALGRLSSKWGCQWARPGGFCMYEPGLLGYPVQDSGTGLSLF